MKRKLAWFGINGVLVGMMYLLFAFGNMGAYGVLWFFTGLGLFTGLMCLNGEVKAEIKKNGFTWNKELEYTFDTIATCAFIYYGYWMLGLCYFIGNMLVISAKAEVEDD